MLTLRVKYQCFVCHDKQTIDVQLTDDFHDIVEQLSDGAICDGCGYPAAVVISIVLIDESTADEYRFHLPRQK